MIKLVAFDWNGTLLSDTQVTVDVDNIILKKYSLKPITVKRYQETFHMPVIDYWKNLGLSDEFLHQHLVDIEILFSKLYKERENKTRSRAGSKETLAFLQKQNILAIIYSNHIVPDIRKQLHRLKINHLIPTVLAREDGDTSHIHNRGKGAKLYNFIKENKFKPHEVISVGDTEEEIEIGKEHGYFTVGITGGYNSASRLKKHKPDFLIHNMKELIGVVKKLNKP